MSKRANPDSEDVVITDQLYRRDPRSPQLEQELAAYHELSIRIASDPAGAIQRFLDLSLELCPAAASAGLSELCDKDGEPVFHWSALRGALAGHVGGTSPRHFSPCGLCLDNHHTILVDRPARVFGYLAMSPAIIEGLIVPLYDTGKRPIGTLWVTSHDPAAKFDPTDARVLEQLAVQLVLAIKLRRKASILVQLEETARDREILVQEVRHRVKNMIQMTSALLELQQRGLGAGEAKSALREAQNRLLVLSSVYESLLLPAADMREVNLSKLLARLITALADTAACSHRILLESGCDDLCLSVDQAVPLGLIVNEAVTNALKHAFEPGQSGNITVRLDCSDERCSLLITDNGRGIIGAQREGSLGMRLMQNLARQLYGRLSIETDAGTKVRLDWPRATAVPGKVALEPVA